MMNIGQHTPSRIHSSNTEDQSLPLCWFEGFPKTTKKRKMTTRDMGTMRKRMTSKEKAIQSNCRPFGVETPLIQPAGHFRSSSSGPFTSTTRAIHTHQVLGGRFFPPELALQPRQPVAVLRGSRFRP